MVLAGSLLLQTLRKPTFLRTADWNTGRVAGTVASAPGAPPEASVEEQQVWFDSVCEDRRAEQALCARLRADTSQDAEWLAGWADLPCMVDPDLTPPDLRQKFDFSHVPEDEFGGNCASMIRTPLSPPSGSLCPAPPLWVLDLRHGDGCQASGQLEESKHPERWRASSMRNFGGCAGRQSSALISW
jgi:hypothetical protein